MSSTDRGRPDRVMVRTACPLDCWDTCTFLAEVEDGKVVGLRGDAGHPVTRGKVCPKARYQLDRHRSPQRLQTPLVRSGGELKPASWDAALDLIAGRLDAARRSGGSRQILHYWDAGSMGTLKNLYQRLFDLIGGVTEPRGSLCWSAGLAAQEADMGGSLSNSPADLAAHATGVIIWGRNPADTNPHLMPFIKEAAERGAVIWVIDPVTTATVRELEARHLAPRPGQDVVLALAVAGELLRRGAYDRGFCRSRGHGSDEFAATVTRLSLAEAAQASGVSEGDILALSDFLAAQRAGGRPTAFLIGYGLQRHSLGGEAVRAIDALAAISGNIGVPGGGANYANRHALGALRDLGGSQPGPGRRLFDRPAFGREVPRLDPPVNVLWCDRANPVAQLPNTNLVADTYRKIGFKVVADLTLTDTAALSDVVLPVADFLEDEDLFLCSWHHFLTWAVPAVEPPGEARPETRIISELAERLGLGHEFRRSPAEWVAYALEPLLAEHPQLANGRDVMSLRGTTFPNPLAIEVPWETGRFATPSGRFEFGGVWRSLEGRLSPEGGGQERQGEGSAPAPDQQGPGTGTVFHLITPQHRHGLHSQFHDQTLRRTSRGTGLPAVYLSPAAARGLGLADGQEVEVTTGQGHLVAHLVLDPGLRDDTALIYSGGTAGYTGQGRPASANLLTSDGITDMGTQAAYYDTRCTVGPVGETSPRE